MSFPPPYSSLPPGEGGVGKQRVPPTPGGWLFGAGYYSENRFSYSTPGRSEHSLQSRLEPMPQATPIFMIRWWACAHVRLFSISSLELRISYRAQTLKALHITCSPSSLSPYLPVSPLPTGSALGVLLFALAGCIIGKTFGMFCRTNLGAIRKQAGSRNAKMRRSNRGTVTACSK